MNEFYKKRRTVVGGELALIAILTSTWVITYLAILDGLDEFSPAGRSIYLAAWHSNENLSVALVGLLIAIALLPLRHWRPVESFAAICGLTAVLSWIYPIFSINSFVVRPLLGVSAFWFAWKVRRWWWVLVGILPIVTVNGVRTFQSNRSFEKINALPSTTTLSIGSVVQEALFFGAVIGVGLIVRQLLSQSGELEQRNTELIRERARAAETAVLDERLRISRELHDVVAHHVTTMTVHAGAARQLAQTAPDKAAESLRHIESAGRNAVNELHQMLGFLRSSSDQDNRESDDRSPTPSLRHLELLKESFGENLECTISVEGDVSNIPAAVDLSAYRIVQEALTNTMKHSTSKSVNIDVLVTESTLDLSIVDQGTGRVGGNVPGTGKVTENGDESSSGGHGIIGIQERASLHGGEVTVGPALESNHGWQVKAHLPIGAPRD